jgi:T5SS/PEP-CTERM-associated repeat protein
MAVLAFALWAEGVTAAPCTVDAFNSCYIGVDAVDASDTQVLDTAAGPYDFVGLGIRSAEPMIPPNDPSFVGNASGTLSVLAGGALSLNYLPLTIGNPVNRPLDNSVLVGVSAGATGVLNVDGGTVHTPLLYIGQADDARPSTGTVTITNGGTVVADFDSLGGPLVNLNAVNIGRGLGSTGTLTVSGAGSSLSTPAGGMSLARQGTATVQVLDGGSVSVFGTLFGATVLPSGHADILVQGEGSSLAVGGDGILLGINVITLAQDDPNHGTATLDVRDGGQVTGNLTVGGGGTVRGDGTISGNVTNRGGVLAPGNSPGTLHIGGNLTQQGGILDIEIASATEFDMIEVGGDVSLEDVLVRFTFTDGFAPRAGDVFDFLRVAPGSLLENIDPVFSVRGVLPGFAFTVGSRGDALTLSALTDAVAVPAPGALGLLLLSCLALVPAMRRA